MAPTQSSSTADDIIEEVVLNPSNLQTSTLPQDAKIPPPVPNTELGFKTSIQTRIGIVNPLQLEAKVVEPHPASKAGGTTNTGRTTTGRSRGELGSGFQDIWGGFKGTAAPSYTKLKHLALFHSDIYATAHGRHDQYIIRQILLEHVLERGGLFVKEVRSGAGETICWRLRSHNSVTETVAMMLRTFSTNRSTKRVVDDLFQLSAGYPTVEDLNDWKELRAQILTRIQFSGPSESPALAMYYNPKTAPTQNDGERDDQHRGQESPPRSPRASASRRVSLNHHVNEPLPVVGNTRPLAEIQVKVTVMQEEIDAPHNQCPLVATVTPTFFAAGKKQVDIKTPIHPQRTVQPELPPAVLRPSTGPRRVSLDLTHPNTETDGGEERPTAPTSYDHRLPLNLSHEISTVAKLDENSSISDRPSDYPSNGDQRPESNAVQTAVSKVPQRNSPGNPGGQGVEALATVTTPCDANNANNDGKHHRRQFPRANVLNLGLSGQRVAISTEAEPCTFEAATMHTTRFDGDNSMKQSNNPIARYQGGTLIPAPTIDITDRSVYHLVDHETQHSPKLQNGESPVDSQPSAKRNALMGANEQHGSVEIQKATSIDLPVQTGIRHDVSTPTKKRESSERNPFPAVFWDIDGNKITPDDDDDDIFHTLASFDDRDGLNAWMVTSPNQAVDIVTDASSSVATSMHAMDDHPIDLFNYEIWQSLLPSSFSEDIY